MKDKMLFVLIALASTFSVCAGKLVVTPRDTETKVNDSTYFTCSTDHLTTGVHWNHGSKYVYTGDVILEPYSERFEIEINRGTGEYNLVIRSVQSEDAGEYICTDDGGIGEQVSAQLIILSGDPNCTSSMVQDVVIGPNSCGLEPENVQLVCTVEFHGTVPPIMEWRNVLENSSALQEVSSIKSGQVVACNVTIKPGIHLDGTSFVCQTTRTRITHHKCYSRTIKVFYAISKYSVLNMTTEDEMFCSINSSHSCRYNWKRSQDDSLLTNNQTLMTPEIGLYKCVVDCSIRNLSCTIIALLVNVSKHGNGYNSATIIVPVVLILLVASFIVGAIYWCKCRRMPESTNHEPPLDRQNVEAEVTVAMPSSKGSINKAFGQEVATYVNKISTTAAVRSGRTITGIAILGNELFAVSKKSSKIEVFETHTDEFKHFRTLRLRMTTEKLEDPVDIASCEESKRLYIVDWRNTVPVNRIYRIDREGELEFFWDIENISCTLFVVRDDKIIISFYSKNCFKIYTSTGDCIRTVPIDSTNARILHTIQLNSGEFVSSVQIGQRCKILFMDNAGTVKQQFQDHDEVERHSNYVYLAARGDDVIVLDFHNRHIFILDSTCTLKKTLLTERRGIHPPSRVCWDASKSLLIVVDNKVDFGGGIWIFKVDL